ncbi:unnamed protein product, partial [Ectocarpus sp. 12 AP-2014]
STHNTLLCRAVRVKTQETHTPPAPTRMKYLIHFSQQHESFWLPELDTLLELNGVEPAAAYDHDTAWAIVSRGHKTSPFLVVDVPSE